MKIKNYQELFSYEDALLAQRVHDTYDCGMSPIALLDDGSTKGLLDNVVHMGSRPKFHIQAYTLKLFYAIQVWNKVAIMTHENPNSLYYWCLHWEDVEGSPFREIRYHKFYNNVSADQVKQLFWSKLEQVANSGEIQVSEFYFMESRTDYEWGGASRYYNTIVVLDETKLEERKGQKWEVFSFPYDKTPHSYTWEEIKHFFIELNLHQLALTFPKECLHKHTAIDDELFGACRRLDLEGMKRAIANGASVNALDKYGSTPLIEVIDCLEEKQNWRPSDEEPAPSEKGEDNFDMVKPCIDFLLEQGADIDLFGRDAESALLEAYYAHSLKAVRYLLGKGANPNYNSFRDGDYCPEKCSSVLNAIDFLISEDYTELEQQMERMIREAEGRLYVHDFDPVQYERTGKITVEVWPCKNHVFLNDRWQCGECDSITIPDLAGEMHTYDISSVRGLKEWYQYFLDNCPFYTDKYLPDSEWQKWWKDGYELMKEVKKLLPEYVTMYYLYEAKPVFVKTYDNSSYYWNRRDKHRSQIE